MSPEAATITIRELEPFDRRALAFTFHHLSAQSRYQRFLSAKPALAPRDMRFLLAVDHWHHDALIAFSPPPRAPIGIARYVRIEPDFDLAEIAIEVVDAWQRRGIGTALAVSLSDRALAAGIRRFSVAMLRDNRGARALLRRLGPATPIASAGNMIELYVDITPTPARNRRSGASSTSTVGHAPPPLFQGAGGGSSTR
jgi:RimJ/RimL family protein N-acetyltransferase